MTQKMLYLMFAFPKLRDRIYLSWIRTKTDNVGLLSVDEHKKTSDCEL